MLSCANRLSILLSNRILNHKVLPSINVKGKRNGRKKGREREEELKEEISNIVQEEKKCM